MSNTSILTSFDIPTATLMAPVVEWTVFKTIHFHHRTYQRGTRYGRKTTPETVELAVLTLLESILRTSQSREIINNHTQDSFQVVDRTNRVSFIFRANASSKEILCITFLDAKQHAQVSWKRQCIIFDFDRMRERENGLIKSNMNIFDWTDVDRKFITAVEIEASSFIKY